MLPGKTKTASLLKKLAVAHGQVEEGIACAGTALECLTYNVRKKTFLFVFAKDGTLQLRLKLKDSLKEAQQLAAKDPTRFEAGKTGWAKLTFAESDPPAQNLLTRWIAESYQLTAPKK